MINLSIVDYEHRFWAGSSVPKCPIVEASAACQPW